MTSKHEWRKHEKEIYLPKNRPEFRDIPAFKFITIEGQGNPNGEIFSECVATLYAVAYALKMQLKKRPHPPEGYIDFTVYPLEGVWDITEKAKKSFTGSIDKEELVYKLMIRQPDFVDIPYFEEILDTLNAKKPSPLLASVKFETICEGPCIQMLHLGSFDDEPISFAKMEAFALEQGLSRVSKVHREIYLSDARKVSPENYKTVLRFNTLPNVDN